MIKVVDHGIGMTEEQLARLFTPFSCAVDDESRRKNPSGNGLGLSICKQIMCAMHGGIEAQSYRKFGTTFTATFPTMIKIQQEAEVDDIMADF